MKTIKKVLASLMALVCACGIVACKPQYDESTVEISFWKGGFGEEFINKVEVEFEKKYPQYDVVLDISSDQSVFANNIELGAKYNTYDLFFTSYPNTDQEFFLEPLNDIVNSKYGSEEKTIKDKYQSTVLNALQKDDGNWYYLSWATAWTGIVYNADIIDGQKYKVPNTTDELITLANSITEVPAFIHFSPQGYWGYFYQVWQAQYDGMDYYEDFMLLKDEQGNSPSKEMLLKDDGRYEVIKALEKMINIRTVYTGSNSQDFTDAQTKFLEGKAAMMVTGTWIESEMGGGANIKMMKTPVISSIIHRTPSISDDTELSNLINAIDAAGTDKSAVPLKGEGYEVTQTDLDAVYEARNMAYCISDDFAMCIPNYSNAKEGAKEFIKYFHSDEVIKIFTDTTNTALPYNYSDGSTIDMSDWSEFAKYGASLNTTAIPLMQYSIDKSVLFTKGGCNPFANAVPVTDFAIEQNRNTAEGYWKNIKSIFEENWNLYLSNAGL